MQRSLVWIALATLLVLGVLLWLRPRDVAPEEHAPESVVTGTPDANARAALEPQRAEALATETETPRANARDVAATPEPVLAPVDPNTPGVITVIVVAKETGEPLANVQVDVRDANANAKAKQANVREPAPAETAQLGDVVLTTATGRVVVDVPPGLTLAVSAWSPNFTTSGERETLEGPGPGERREVRFELATRDDGVFHGRVIDRETQAPIANAPVTGRSNARKESEVARTDADGRFRLSFASWQNPTLAIAVPGYAKQTFWPDASAPTPERPFVVALERSASIVVTLRGYTLPAGARAVLVATAPSYALVHEAQRRSLRGTGDPDTRWTAEFDASMRAELSDLPCGAELSLAAYAAKREVHRAQEKLTLVPRERRELVWEYDAGCTLTVKALDAEGRALASVPLWLLDDEGDERYLDAGDQSAAVKLGKTDAAGVAVFDAVAAGAWKLGPAARAMKPGELDPDAFAPVATRFTIATGEREHALELRLARALYIRGTVLDPRGAPPAKASVRTRGEHGSLRVSANADKTGAFVVGPLAPGRHTLRASARGWFADSDEIEADAGASGVTLQLKPGARIQGRVVDAATGQGCSARVTCAGLAGETNWRTTQTTPDGTFQFGGLAAGRYSIAATTDDGRTGCVRELEREVDVDAAEVRVAVTPGARLRVRYDGSKDLLLVEVEHDGVRFASDSVLAGGATLFHVPAGVVRVRSKAPQSPDEWRVDTVTLPLGEEREFVLH